jgi:transcriptional regulator of acetoin/glycerol metabolism
LKFDPTTEELDKVVQRLETLYLKAVLSKSNGKVSAASKLAGISRATFYKKLGIDDQED